MCMYFSERVSARPPGLPVSFYIPIDFDFARGGEAVLCQKDVQNHKKNEIKQHFN